MTTLLIVLGLASLLLLAAPDLVTMGLFMLILPGLIMAVIPTAFLYLVAFALTRWLLPLQPGLTLDAAAAALTAALGLATAAPWHAAGRRAFDQAIKPDVVPARPVRLAGHVRLDRTRASTSSVDGVDVPECDALCAALLDTPGVTAVTLGGTTHKGEELRPVTYRLVSAAQAPQSRLAPRKPEDIVQHLPDPSRGSGPDGWKTQFDARDARRHGIAARWALRLARDERLVADLASVEPDLKIVVSDRRVDERHRIHVQEVEVSDRRGVRFRKRHVVGRPWMTPFALLPEGSGGLKMHWEVARITLRGGPRYHDFKPAEMLFAHTTLAEPRVEGDAVTAMRDALDAATRRRDLPAADPVFALATPWFKTLHRRSIDEADVALIAALIGDPRVTNLPGLYDGGKPDPSLRDPIMRRLLLGDAPPGVVVRLDGLIRAMPPGIFATGTPLEARILRDAAARLRAPALVERLADQGGAAAPLLAAILEEEVALHREGKRDRVLAAVRRALIRLGPAARSELPDVVRTLRDASVARTSDDADQWRFALARMGRPVDALGWPRSYTAEQVAEGRDRLRNRLAGYDPERDAR